MSFKKIKNKDLLKNLNYQNYIYLFNNPNEIVISQKGDPVKEAGSYFVDQPAQQPVAAYEFLDSANAPGATKIIPSNKLKTPTLAGFGGITVFKDTDELGDFPPLYNGQNNQQGLRVKETIFNINDATLLNVGIPTAATLTPTTDGYFKVTNDFGYSPKIRHEIQYDAGRYRYHFKPDASTYTYVINLVNGDLDGSNNNEIDSLLTPGAIGNKIYITNL